MPGTWIPLLQIYDQKNSVLMSDPVNNSLCQEAKIKIKIFTIEDALQNLSFHIILKDNWKSEETIWSKQQNTFSNFFGSKMSTLTISDGIYFDSINWLSGIKC